MEYTEINARQSALNTQGVQQGKNSLDKVTHHHGQEPKTSVLFVSQLNRLAVDVFSFLYGRED